MVRPDQVKAGRFQPRTEISQAGLEELKASIRRSGLIEPIVVRPSEGGYALVAGERRLRAAQELGIPQVPAVIKTLSDREALELSLVENVQRENLNPMEEAAGYDRLLNEFGYTQEDLAAAVGKDRATIANTVRLLTLPHEIQEGLRAGAIAAGHAKALLGLVDRARQLAVYHRVVREGLSVRQAESLAGASAPARRRARRIDPQLRPLEDALRRALGTKVSLVARKKGGRILIDYFSQEDLTRILQLLGLGGDGGRGDAPAH
jgi:ParB family chromosome partitioning protein